MSADFESQHFGQPEEPGTPGVQRYRRARAALAAWETMKGKSGYLARGDALAAALQEFMPTYKVMESIPGAGQRVAAKNLADIPTAQQWIADNDPAARRTFHIEAEEKSL